MVELGYAVFCFHQQTLNLQQALTVQILDDNTQRNQGKSKRNFQTVSWLSQTFICPVLTVLACWVKMAG